MRWAIARDESPDKPGQYYVWSATLGKCVMGFNDGWGAQDPVYWLQADQCPQQQPDGSFGSFQVLT